jgi:hypothetical protein
MWNELPERMLSRVGAALVIAAGAFPVDDPMQWEDAMP